MTITAKTTFTAPKRKTTLISWLDSGRTISARQNADEVRISGSEGYTYYVSYDHIDAFIELLFAVKADRAAAAELEAKWLAEQAEVDVA